MSEFLSKSIRLVGNIKLNGPVDLIFQLFSPEGERQWVPGWNPEPIHPARAALEKGFIFRTKEEKGDAIWIVTHFDSVRHEVEYYRIELQRYVAQIKVQCIQASESITDASIIYEFSGLSKDGNQEIARMTQASYDQKMERWTGWINNSLETQSG